MRVALVTSAGFPEPLWKDADSPLVAARPAVVAKPLSSGGALGAAEFDNLEALADSYGAYLP
jgi:hypothetical protein